MYELSRGAGFKSLSGLKATFARKKAHRKKYKLPPFENLLIVFPNFLCLKGQSYGRK